MTDEEAVQRYPELVRLPSEGVLYTLDPSFGLEQRLALKRRIHRDECTCRGDLDHCRGLHAISTAPMLRRTA